MTNGILRTRVFASHRGHFVKRALTWGLSANEYRAGNAPMRSFRPLAAGLIQVWPSHESRIPYIRCRRATARHRAELFPRPARSALTLLIYLRNSLAMVGGRLSMPWMRRVWVRRLGRLAWIQGLRLSVARRLTSGASTTDPEECLKGAAEACLPGCAYASLRIRMPEVRRTLRGNSEVLRRSVDRTRRLRRRVAQADLGAGDSVQGQRLLH